MTDHQVAIKVCSTLYAQASKLRRLGYSESRELFDLAVRLDRQIESNEAHVSIASGSSQ